MKTEYKLLQEKDSKALEKEMNDLADKGWVLKSFRIVYVGDRVWKYALMARDQKLRNLE